MMRIKVCCMASAEEVRLAIATGASALGFVSRMPSGPGPIPEETIVRLVADVPPPVATFLLTSLTDPDGIIAQRARCGTNTVQLCDAVEPAAIAELRRAMPGVAIVPVVHVAGEDSVDEALAAARSAHALLLDSGNPSAPVKELGGTGRTHDWGVSARIAQECGKPVFLAGGLTAGNVGEAIRRVRPWAVDLCSGVRTDDVLDGDKLRAFVAAVGAADAP